MLGKLINGKQQQSPAKKMCPGKQTYLTNPRRIEQIKHKLIVLKTL